MTDWKAFEQFETTKTNDVKYAMDLVNSLDSGKRFVVDKFVQAHLMMYGINTPLEVFMNLEKVADIVIRSVDYVKSFGGKKDE